MNIKKGLTRIFILGLVISPIAGFLSATEESKNISANILNITYEVRREIKQEPCASIVKSNPKIFPELQSAKSCYWTFIYWETIRKWQDKNGKAGQIIDDDAVYQTMRAESDSAKSEVRWAEAGYFIIYYLLLWVTLFVIFFTGKWIYKGFKSK